MPMEDNYMTGQILWGSLVLGVCSTIHLICIVWWIKFLQNKPQSFYSNSTFKSVFFPIGGTFIVLVFSHTCQVWIWAISFVGLGALPDFNQAIYFSLVTYTTLGYGDVILNDAHKIFGAMGSVTGLLNFGVSTAVLVSIISKVLPNQFGER